jgi:hypothetical protein
MRSQSIFYDASWDSGQPDEYEVSNPIGADLHARNGERQAISQWLS